MNSFKKSKQDTNVLTEEKEIEQQTELFPKENKAQKPYVFYFNKCFVSAGFAADVVGNLAYVSRQRKIK